MSKKLRIGLAAIVILIAVAAILFYKKIVSFTKILFGSDGNGGNGNPYGVIRNLKDPFVEGTVPSEPAPDQPPVNFNEKTTVYLTFSQMAAVSPEAVGPILKTIGAGKVGQLLSFNGKTGAYQENGIVQVSKANPTLWTRIRAGLVGANKIIKGITPESKGGTSPSNPRDAKASSEVPGVGYIQMGLDLLGDWNDVCNGARATVAFTVNADKDTAPAFVTKSGLMEQLRQLEQLSELAKAAGKQFGTFTQVIQVLSTRA